MNKKAIVLLSGGLDSILATKLMLEQGVEVVAVNYLIEFAACGGKEGHASATRAAKILGVPLKVIDITQEYLEMFQKPKHGYGANINPCIDCKIFMLKKAKDYMKEVGASFLVTGEVLGERPMSQRRDALNIIEKDAGVRGILLRPLTAKLLPITLPEEAGVVDREKLLDIRGRSRKPQIELAKKYGISDYPNPAGGCLLTDPGFSDRVKELMSHKELTLDNLRLLTVGRHFRIADSTKLVVGRDEKENEMIESLALEGDVFLKLKDYQGPISLLRGVTNDEIIKEAASIAAYHTKFRNEKSLVINYWKRGKEEAAEISISPASPEKVESIRI